MRTNIIAKTQETTTLRRSKEGVLTWIGALILEVVMFIVAFYIADLIGECAGLWHHEASLGRDLWKYYGSGLSYADNAAKWFGFRKALWNFVLAVTLELLALYSFCKCLGIELSTQNKSEVSLGKRILAFGASVRIAIYTITMIFCHSSSLYGPLHDDFAFRKIYSRVAAHDRTWILLWALVCVVLALVMYAFASQRNHLIIVACLLIIVGLIAIGTYLNDAKTLRDAMQNAAIFIENVGEIIFKH